MMNNIITYCIVMHVSSASSLISMHYIYIYICIYIYI